MIADVRGLTQMNFGLGNSAIVIATCMVRRYEIFKRIK